MSSECTKYSVAPFASTVSGDVSLCASGQFDNDTLDSKRTRELRLSVHKELATKSLTKQCFRPCASQCVERTRRSFCLMKSNGRVYARHSCPMGFRIERDCECSFDAFIRRWSETRAERICSVARYADFSASFNTKTLKKAPDSILLDNIIISAPHERERVFKSCSSLRNEFLRLQKRLCFSNTDVIDTTAINRQNKKKSIFVIHKEKHEEPNQSGDMERLDLNTNMPLRQHRKRNELGVDLRNQRSALNEDSHEENNILHARISSRFRSAPHDPSETTDPNIASEIPSFLLPEKCGWLYKKVGMNKWQLRYFELKGSRLYYFVSDVDGMPRGAILLNHTYVLRREHDDASFTIINTSAPLHILKFVGRNGQHVVLRKHCTLRPTDGNSNDFQQWISTIHRASLFCNAGVCEESRSVTHQSIASPATLIKKISRYPRRLSIGTNIYNHRDNRVNVEAFSLTSKCGFPILTSSPHAATIAQLRSCHLSVHFEHQVGTLGYLKSTNKLLWKLHPLDLMGIQKRAANAQTRSKYMNILSKYQNVLEQIYLPAPRPISIGQTLRDILPEIFLINGVHYGRGFEPSRSCIPKGRDLENIFDVLDSHVSRCTQDPETRDRMVSVLLQACARTIAGGDSYFVVHCLLGNASMIIRPTEVRGHPIEINSFTKYPARFRISVVSAFSFHHVKDVERFSDPATLRASTGMDLRSSSYKTTAAVDTPKSILCVRTYHVQEFDFESGKSARWIRLHTENI